MIKETKNTLVGVFFGGFTALLLGVAATREYDLGLGMILPTVLCGSFLGWLFCDLPDTKRSVKTAWKQVVGWHPDTKYWRESLLAGAGMGSLIFSFSFWLLVPALFVHKDPLFFVGVVGISVTLAIIFGIMFFLIAPLTGMRIEAEEEWLFRSLLLRWNFVAAPFSLIWYFGKGTVRLLRRVPFAVKTTGKFMWRVFVLAHSDNRRIAAIGTGFGTTAGFLYAYFTKDDLLACAVLGGILCAIFFVIWRELVAVRLLGIKA